MQTPSEIRQNRVEAPRLGRVVFSHPGFPLGPTDAIVRQIQDLRTEVVIVDVPARDSQRAIHAIELIRATTLQIAIFANGEMTNPAAIVSAMRAGAGDFLEHAAGSGGVLGGLGRC